MPIHIGLAGWGDHDRLYAPGSKTNQRLKLYANHFPIVEVDSTFYAIQSRDRFAKWVKDTPESLCFVVKAFQGMTGHQRGAALQANETSKMFAAFRESLVPVIEAGRLVAALFQYPPWFDCTFENVRLLRETKQSMAGIPCALEFRHQSWFYPGFKEKTLAFMQQEGWIHSVCDEPQAGLGSVPTILKVTDANATIVRMHGRNTAGWTQSSAPNWREVRYLYHYSKEELTEWAEWIRQLEKESENIYVIFNNNSGGDAADNAKELMLMLGHLRPDGESPAWTQTPIIKQLDLF